MFMKNTSDTIGLIFLLSQFVTSRHISKICSTMSSSVNSNITAAKISNEEIAQNLRFRLNLFRNATQNLTAKYIPPLGKRITSDRIIAVLSSAKIMQLDVTSAFSLEPSKLTNASLVDVYRNLTLIASFLDLMKEDEDRNSHGELSSFIREANQTLYLARFDLHTILRSGHNLSDTDCMEKANINTYRESNNQFRFYRDFVILNESIAYVNHILSQPNGLTVD